MPIIQLAKIAYKFVELPSSDLGVDDVRMCRPNFGEIRESYVNVTPIKTK